MIHNYKQSNPSKCINKSAGTNMKEKIKCKKDNRQQKPLIPGYLLPAGKIF